MISRRNTGVSPVVGVILMVAVTVLLSAAVFAAVTALSPSGDASERVASTSVDASRGSDSIGNYTEVQITNAKGDSPVYVKTDLNSATEVGTVGDSIRLYEGADYSVGTSITVLREGDDGEKKFVQRVTNPSYGSGPAADAPAQLMVDNFEDGDMVGWDTSQLNEERGYIWEINSTTTYAGSNAGYFRYGVESCYACKDGSGRVVRDFQATDSSGPYVFWAYEAQEPEDDIQFVWHGIASVNFYREADSNKDIRIHHDGTQTDTDTQMPNGEWVKFKMTNVDFTDGTFDITATTESGTTLFTYTDRTFNETATQSVDGVTIRGVKANNNVGKYFFDNIQYGQDE